jgi:hypothetical protein
LIPFTQNRFAVSCDIVMKIHNPGVYNDLLISELRLSVPVYCDCGTLLSEFLKNCLMPSQIKAITRLIIEESWGCYKIWPVTTWFFSSRGLNRLQSLDMRIYGLLDQDHGLKLLLEEFTRDERRKALLRQQERCPSVRVSLELYSTEDIEPMQAALVYTQSKIQARASMLAEQTSGERDASIAKRVAKWKAKHEERRAAVRQKRGLRPLRS